MQKKTFEFLKSDLDVSTHGENHVLLPRSSSFDLKVNNDRSCSQLLLVGSLDDFVVIGDESTSYVCTCTSFGTYSFMGILLQLFLGTD